MNTSRTLLAVLLFSLTLLSDLAFLLTPGLSFRALHGTALLFPHGPSFLPLFHTATVAPQPIHSHQHSRNSSPRRFSVCTSLRIMTPKKPSL